MEFEGVRSENYEIEPSIMGQLLKDFSNLNGGEGSGALMTEASLFCSTVNSSQTQKEGNVVAGCVLPRKNK